MYLYKTVRLNHCQNCSEDIPKDTMCVGISLGSKSRRICFKCIAKWFYELSKYHSVEEFQQEFVETNL